MKQSGYELATIDDHFRAFAFSNRIRQTLVMFVRKRDPRYKAYTARQAQSPGHASSTPASGTVTPRKTAPKSTFVAQDWQKVAEPSDSAADLDWARAEGAEGEEWECIACNKTFRSEAAWHSHERSKKHLRAVEHLKREMQNEELELDLGQGDAEPADAGVKGYESEEEEQGTGTAGADATTGDDSSRGGVATPDRAASAPVPKEEVEVATKGEGRLSPRPGRQRRTGKTVRTPSPSVTTTTQQSLLPNKPSSQKGRARCSAARDSPAPRQAAGDDGPVHTHSQENRGSTLTLDDESHHDTRNDGDDVVREGDDAGAADSITGESLSKREKRRAREATKKAREAEAKGGCAVSFFLDPILQRL